MLWKYIFKKKKKVPHGKGKDSRTEKEKLLIARSEVKFTQSTPTLSNPMEHSPRNSPGQNTGMGNLSLQGIFPTQGSNQSLLHYKQILYQLSYYGELERSL